jgi:hypothetical protein
VNATWATSDGFIQTVDAMSSAVMPSRPRPCFLLGKFTKGQVARFNRSSGGGRPRGATSPSVEAEHWTIGDQISANNFDNRTAGTSAVHLTLKKERELPRSNSTPESARRFFSTRHPTRHPSGRMIARMDIAERHIDCGVNRIQ